MDTRKAGPKREPVESSDPQDLYGVQLVATVNSETAELRRLEFRNLPNSEPLSHRDFLFGTREREAVAGDFLKALGRFLCLLAKLERQSTKPVAIAMTTTPLHGEYNLRKLWTSLGQRKAEKIKRFFRAGDPIWQQLVGSAQSDILDSQPWSTLLTDNGDEIVPRLLVGRPPAPGKPFFFVIQCDGRPQEPHEIDMLAPEVPAAVASGPIRGRSSPGMPSSFDNMLDMYSALRRFALDVLQTRTTVPEVTIVDYSALNACQFIEALLEIGATVRVLTVHPACTNSVSRKRMALLLEQTLMPIWMRNHHLSAAADLSLWYYHEKNAKGVVHISDMLVCQVDTVNIRPIAKPGKAVQQNTQRIPWNHTYGTAVHEFGSSPYVEWVGTAEKPGKFDEAFGDIVARPPDCSLSHLRKHYESEAALQDYVEGIPSIRSIVPNHL